MSGITDLAATRQVLLELARVVKLTRQTLAHMVEADERSRRPLRRRSGRLSATLDHLGDVREGFILSQRASPSAAISELRQLVRDILIDWQWVQEMNLSLTPNPQLELVDQQLVFYNHTLVALAVLPRLPAEAITFPHHRRSYRDVAPPTLPNELLARIDEIERTIYQADLRPVRSLAYGPFRRTYAFFEASNWLVNNYLEPLLGE